MTKDRAQKQAARTRQATTGEPYVVARRRIQDGRRTFHEDCCANCDTPLPPQIQGLLCSEGCTQAASWVRYVKKAISDGRDRDPDVQDAIQMKLAHVLGGGYRESARRISAAVRAAVIERDDGRCQSCGEAGTEVDHVDTTDNTNLENLQLLCHHCHMTKSQLNLRPAPPEIRAIAAALHLRVTVEPPLRLCDDVVRWPAEWRRLKSERRARLLDELAELGFDRNDFPGVSWADMWDAALDDGGYFGDGSTGTIEDIEHGWYLRELAARDD